MGIEFARIQASDLRAGFSCGQSALDAFFQKHALANDRINVGRTYVLRSQDEPDLPLVIGFVTLSMSAVVPATLPNNAGTSLPRYPTPVVLIGRLATDTRARGRGFGERLLADAFDLVLSTSEVVGCFGVIVDAKDEQAMRFYERYGFRACSETLSGGQRRMFIAIDTIRESTREP